METSHLKTITHQYISEECPLPLAAEINLHIFSFLPISALASIACVSKRWKEFSEDNSLWQNYLVQLRQNTPSSFTDLFEDEKDQKWISEEWQFIENFLVESSLYSQGPIKAKDLVHFRITDEETIKNHNSCFAKFTKIIFQPSQSFAFLNFDQDKKLSPEQITMIGAKIIGIGTTLNMAHGLMLLPYNLGMNQGMMLSFSSMTMLITGVTMCEEGERRKRAMSFRNHKNSFAISYLLCYYKAAIYSSRNPTTRLKLQKARTDLLEYWKVHVLSQTGVNPLQQSILSEWIPNHCFIELGYKNRDHFIERMNQEALITSALNELSI